MYMTLMEASSLLNLPASHIESVLAEESDAYSDTYNELFDEIEESEYND